MAKAVHLALLTDENMRLVFTTALESLNIRLSQLPPHVCLLLDALGGIPRHVAFVFAALALSNEHDRFIKQDFIAGLDSHVTRPSNVSSA